MTATMTETFAALADPTRFEIVTHLCRGAASVSELARPHAMSLRAVLKHVELLEAAGVVRTNKVGRVRQCELRQEAIAELETWASDLRHRWERRLDRLEQQLSEGENRE